MGIILKILGKTASFVGEKAAEAAVHVAKNVAVHEVEKAAVKSFVKGGVVYKTTVGAATVVGAVADALIPGSTKEESEPTKTTPDPTKISVKEVNNDGVLITIDADKDFTLVLKEKDKKYVGLSKKLEPYVTKANVLARKAKPYLDRIYSSKMTYLTLANSFASILAGIEDLPVSLAIKNPYFIDILPINEFITYMNNAEESFSDEDLFDLVVFHGFKEELLDDLKTNNCVDEAVSLLNNNRITGEEGLKSSINSFKRIIGTYERTIRFANEYIEKINVCNKRFVKELSVLSAKQKRNNSYGKLNKYISSLYYSAHLIFEIINIDLIVDSRVNANLLTRMRRRII